MDLTITSSEDIPTEVFVKQRISDDDDEFVAVASPEQLESLKLAPGPDTTFYRSSSVQLYATNPDALNWIYTEVQTELELLVANLNALDVPAVPSTTVVIS